MKKFYVFIIFIMIFCQSFSWEKVEMFDDENNLTGGISIRQLDVTQQEGFLMIGKDSEKHFMFVGFCKDIGIKENSIKVQVDQDNPVILYGELLNDNQFIWVDLSNNLLEKMKKGKIIKVFVTDYDGQKVSLNFKLDDFEKSYDMVK